MIFDLSFLITAFDLSSTCYDVMIFIILLQYFIYIRMILSSYDILFI